MTNVSRIVALGGSICRIVRGSEALGAPDSYRLLTALRGRVGPPKETLDSGDSEGSMSGARKLEVWKLGCLDVGMFGC